MGKNKRDKETIKKIFFRMVGARNKTLGVLKITSIAFAAQLGYGFGLSFEIGGWWGQALSISLALILTYFILMLVDHLLSSTLPYSTRKVIRKEINVTVILLLILSLSLLVATSLTSIMGNPITVDLLYKTPEGTGKERDRARNISSKRLQIFIDKAKQDSITWVKVTKEEEKKTAALFNNKSDDVNRQLKVYSNTLDKEENWASKNMHSKIAAIDKQKESGKTAIASALSDYKASSNTLLWQTKEEAATTSKTVASLLERDSKMLADNDAKKSNLDTYMFWLEIFCGSASFVLCIFIGYIGKENKLKEPEYKSLAVWSTEKYAELWNKAINALEDKWQVDLNRDGTIAGIAPNKQPIKFNSETLDSRGAERIVEAGVENLGHQLSSKINTLDNENLALKEEVKNLQNKSNLQTLAAKVQKSNLRQPQLLSLKSRAQLSSKIIGIENLAEYTSLTKKSQTDCLRYEKSILKSKKSIFELKKEADNRLRATHKSAKEITKAVNLTKLLWLIEVLDFNGFKSKVKGQILEVTKL